MYSSITRDFRTTMLSLLTKWFRPVRGSKVVTQTTPTVLHQWHYSTICRLQIVVLRRYSARGMGFHPHPSRNTETRNFEWCVHHHLRMRIRCLGSPCLRDLAIGAPSSNLLFELYSLSNDCLIVKLSTPTSFILAQQRHWVEVLKRALYKCWQWLVVDEWILETT